MQQLMQQRAWVINHYAEGELKGTELTLVEQTLKPLVEGEVRIKTQLLSLDAATTC